MITKACRYHDISVGHRVVGHEGKCQHLHGHNYRIHFVIEGPKLDAVGRVLDFSVIKEKLCMWLEEHWDHKFLAWDNDPLFEMVLGAVDRYDKSGFWREENLILQESVVFISFNPTAENMAEFLLMKIGPDQLKGTGCVLTSVTIEETRKCSVICNRWA